MAEPAFSYVEITAFVDKWMHWCSCGVGDPHLQPLSYISLVECRSEAEALLTRIAAELRQSQDEGFPT
jgi:hypothetical protein